MGFIRRKKKVPIKIGKINLKKKKNRAIINSFIIKHINILIISNNSNILKT